jgi:hypothetical protein
MAFDEFEEDDDYRRRVTNTLDPDSGIAGPGDGGYTGPAMTTTAAPGDDDYRNRVSSRFDDDEPSTPQPRSEPYTNWNDERNWATNEFARHVQSKPFLYGKVSQKDLDQALKYYNAARANLPNRGDAFNETLDRMGWWTGQNTYNPPAASPSPSASPSTTAPSGFNSQVRDRVVQGWANSGTQFANTRQGIEQYLASLGSAGQGWRVDRDDKVYDPGGRVYDWIGDVGTDRATKRTGYTTDSRYASVTGSSKPKVAAKSLPAPMPKAPSIATPTESLGAPPAPPINVADPAAPAANDFLTQVRAAITGRLEKLSGDPSIKDPALAAQSSAFRQARDRGATQQRAQAAERAAANGTLQGGQSSGSFDTTIGGIAESAGQDIASNDAQLVWQEVQARRDEVQDLLSMALQSGDAESARDLQAELARMDAELRRQQMAQQHRQFITGLGEDRRQFNASDAYRNRVHDDMFGRQVGRDYEDDQRYWSDWGYGG